MKLKHKINIVFILLVLFATLLTGGLAYYQAKEVLMEKILNGLESTLNSRIAHIQHAINLKKEQADIIASTYLAKNLSSDGINDPDIVNKLQLHINYIYNRFRLTEIASGVAAQNTSVELIEISDKNGTIIASTQSTAVGLKHPSDLLSNIREQHTFFAGYVYDTLNNQNYLTICSRIIDYRNGEFAGVVILKMNTYLLRTICFDFDGLGKSGEVLLAHLHKTNKSIEFIIPARNIGTFTKLEKGIERGLPTQQALLGFSGKGTAIDYRGLDILAVWRRIPDLDWAASIEIDLDEALIPLQLLRNRMLFNFSIILCLSLIAAHFISVSLTSTLKKLTESFEKTSRGELPEITPVESTDEIGHLTKSANETIEYLRNIINHAEKLGNGDYNCLILPKGKQDELGKSLMKMTENLKRLDEDKRNTIWIQQSIASLNDAIRGDMTTEELLDKALYSIAEIISSKAAVIYVYSNIDNMLKPKAVYAVSLERVPEKLQPGEGLCGQAFLSKKMIILKNVPADYLTIRTSFSEVSPYCIVTLPLIFRNKIKGVAEFALTDQCSEIKKQFLEKIAEILAISVETSESRKRVQELLEESQSQTEELSLQQEELLQQTNKLLSSEEELRNQQEELMQSNKELEDKSLMLEQKAQELERISQYKSEFLANMSHELRTPLNSIMLLSKLMGDNTEGNLSSEQADYAKIIFNTGNNLLLLINDILDLTKIEAGRIDIQPEFTDLSTLFKNLDGMFMPLAKEKKISFSCKPDNELPKQIYTDGLRVSQILTNILSNAFKFTEKGSVQIRVSTLSAEENSKIGLKNVPMIRFTITDTGIGIPTEHQCSIFDAFHQVDSSTRRKFGGTGLGLSISMKLANLLGGNINLISEPGKGSTFIVYIPIHFTDENTISNITTSSTSHANKNKNFTFIHPKKILLVEDEEAYAYSLSLFLEKNGFVCVSVKNAEKAQETIRKFCPDVIITDLGLPGTSGKKMLETLHNEKEFKDIPVIILSGNNISVHEEKELKKFASAIVVKTNNSHIRLLEELTLIIQNTNAEKEKQIEIIKSEIWKGKKILLVDDDVRNIYSLTKLLESQGVSIISALNGAEAIELLKENTHINLVIMDIMMPEMDGYTTIREIRKIRNLKKIPIIALTAKAMPEDREKAMQSGASDYMSKPLNASKLLSLIQIWLNN